MVEHQQGLKKIGPSQWGLFDKTDWSGFTKYADLRCATLNVIQTHIILAVKHLLTLTKNKPSNFISLSRNLGVRLVEC